MTGAEGGVCYDDDQMAKPVKKFIGEYVRKKVWPRSVQLQEVVHVTLSRSTFSQTCHYNPLHSIGPFTDFVGPPRATYVKLSVQVKLLFELDFIFAFILKVLDQGVETDSWLI